MSHDYGLPQLDLPQLNLVNALPSLKRQDLKVSDTQRPQIQVPFTTILPGTNEDQDEEHVDFTLEVVANPSEDCSHCSDSDVSQSRSRYGMVASSTDRVGTSRSEPSIQSARNDPNDRHGEESKDVKESGTNSLSSSIQTVRQKSPTGPSATQMARAISRKERRVSSTLVSTIVTANDMLEKVFGEPLPEGIGSKSLRLVQIVLGGLCSALIAGLFSTFSLVISGLWAVPGHQDASFVDGLLNRLVWSISPCFLGAFFPAVGHPDFMTDWKSHRFFVSVSLVPFIIADVLFPYVAGTDSNLKVFFSTCFWPTTTCIFFLPSMVAGIRRCRGDPDWQELKSQLLYIRTECNEFKKDFGRLLVCFIVVVAPVNLHCAGLCSGVAEHGPKYSCNSAACSIDVHQIYMLPSLQICFVQFELMVAYLWPLSVGFEHRPTQCHGSVTLPRLAQCTSVDCMRLRHHLLENTKASLKDILWVDVIHVFTMA